MVTLEIATPSDLPDIVEIYNSTVLSRMVTADLDPVSVESRRPWFDAHNEHRRPLWVVRENGSVNAWVSLSDFYGRPAYNATAEVSIYLSEGCRDADSGNNFSRKSSKDLRNSV